MEEEHQKLVGRMISGAEDSDDFFHRIKKSAAWSGGEEKRKDWTGHWQCDSEVHFAEDESWRNGELRNFKEDVSKMKENSFKKDTWQIPPKNPFSSIDRNSGRGGEDSWKSRAV